MESSLLSFFEGIDAEAELPASDTLYVSNARSRSHSTSNAINQTKLKGTDEENCTQNSKIDSLWLSLTGLDELSSWILRSQALASICCLSWDRLKWELSHRVTPKRDNTQSADKSEDGGIFLSGICDFELLSKADPDVEHWLALALNLCSDRSGQEVARGTVHAFTVALYDLACKDDNISTVLDLILPHATSATGVDSGSFSGGGDDDDGDDDDDYSGRYGRIVALTDILLAHTLQTSCTGNTGSSGSSSGNSGIDSPAAAATASQTGVDGGVGPFADFLLLFLVSVFSDKVEVAAQWVAHCIASTFALLPPDVSYWGCNAHYSNSMSCNSHRSSSSSSSSSASEACTYSMGMQRSSEAVGGSSRDGISASQYPNVPLSVAQLLHLATQMQMIFSLMEGYFVLPPVEGSSTAPNGQSSSAATTTDDQARKQQDAQKEEQQTNEGNVDRKLVALVEDLCGQQLHSFACSYRALFPALTAAIRSALLFCAVSDRHDITQLMCASAPTASEVDALGRMLSSNCMRKVSAPRLLSPCYTSPSSMSAPVNPNSTAEAGLSSGCVSDRGPDGVAGDSADQTGAAATATATATATSTATATAPLLPLLRVEGDEGYDYLLRMSRGECNQLLAVLPPGSFMVRPHETSPQQLFLSFRTAAPTAPSNSFPAAGNAGSAATTPTSSAGPPTELGEVKHAIIRRETSEAGGNDLAGGTSETGGNDLAGGTSETGGNDLAGGTSGRQQEGFTYQCGKLGPAPSLIDILRQISDILDYPLLFQPVSAAGGFATDKDRRQGLSTRAALCAESDVPFLSLDLNRGLWEYATSHLASWVFINLSTAARAAIGDSLPPSQMDTVDSCDETTTDSNPYAAELVGIAASGAVAEGVGASNSNGGSSGSSGSVSYPNLSPTGDQAAAQWRAWAAARATEDCAWGVAAYPHVMYTTFERILSTLAIKKYLITLTPLVQLAGELAVKDVTGQYPIEEVSPAGNVAAAGPLNASTRSVSFDNEATRTMYRPNGAALIYHQLHAALSASAPSGVTVGCNKYATDYRSHRDWQRQEQEQKQEQKQEPRKEDAVEEAARIALLSEGLIRPFEAILHRLEAFVQRSEQVVHAALLPSLPSQQWLLPAQAPYPEHANMPLTPTAAAAMSPIYFRLPLYGSVDDLPLAERLLALVERALGPRAVRLPGHGHGYGGNEYLATHCFEMNDFTVLLTRWRDLFVQHESIVTQQRAAMRAQAQAQQVQARARQALSLAQPLSTRSLQSTLQQQQQGQQGDVEGNSSATAAVLNVSVSSVDSVDGSVAPDDSSFRSVEGEPPEGGDSGGSEGWGDEALTMPYDDDVIETPVVSTHTANSSSTLSQGTYQLLQRINQLLQIDITCATKDCVQYYISWFYSHKMIYQITKPADHAFSSSHTFFRYIDPWEVKALHDFSLAGNRCRLGRHVYAGATPSSVGSGAAGCLTPTSAAAAAAAATAAAVAIHASTGSGSATASANLSPHEAARRRHGTVHPPANRILLPSDSCSSLKDAHMHGHDSRTNLSSLAGATSNSLKGSFAATVGSICKMHRFCSGGYAFLRLVSPSTAEPDGVAHHGRQHIAHEMHQIFADWVNIRSHEFLLLWDYLSAEQYIAAVISSAAPHTVRERLPLHCEIESTATVDEPSPVHYYTSAAGGDKSGGTGGEAGGGGCGLGIAAGSGLHSADHEGREKRQQRDKKEKQQPQNPILSQKAIDLLRRSIAQRQLLVLDSTFSTYLSTLSKYLYRNACFGRLTMRQRYVPTVQVDIYGLREVLALHPIAAGINNHNSGRHSPTKLSGGPNTPRIIGGGNVGLLPPSGTGGRSEGRGPASARTAPGPALAVPSGVSPQAYLDLVRPASLTPSATTHASSIDVYAVIRLAKRTRRSSSQQGQVKVPATAAGGRAGGTRTPTGTSSSGGGGSGGGSGLLRPALNRTASAVPATAGASLSTKNCPDGSVVTATHKAEVTRAALSPHAPSADDKRASAPLPPAGTVAISGTAPHCYSNHVSWPHVELSTVSHSADYLWREQALFRFPLPEGLLTAHIAPTPIDVLTSNSTSRSSSRLARASSLGSTNSQNSTSSQAGGTCTPLGAFRSQGSGLGSMGGTGRSAMGAGAEGVESMVPVPKSLAQAPSVVVISVFERTFFSDSKLGELELDLGDLSTKSVLRGWFPLVNDKSISWLIYLQVRLKLSLMHIDAPSGPTLSSAINSTSSSGGGSSGVVGRCGGSGNGGSGNGGSGSGFEWSTSAFPLFSPTPRSASPSPTTAAAATLGFKGSQGIPPVARNSPPQPLPTGQGGSEGGGAMVGDRGASLPSLFPPASLAQGSGGGGGGDSPGLHSPAGNSVIQAAAEEFEMQQQQYQRQAELKQQKSSRSSKMFGQLDDFF